jgi:hypothetical protein
MISWPLKYTYGQRISVIGPQGSGKTVVEQTLLRQKDRVLVLDTKQDPKDDWKSVGVPIKKLGKLRPGRYIWAASKDFITDPDTQSQFFEKQLDNGPLVIGVDEAYHLFLTRGLRLLATQGRGKRVSLVSCMQRPRSIPLFLLSDANYWVVFNLQLDDDRKSVEKSVGHKIDWETLKANEHAFIVLDGKGGSGGPYRLPDPKKSSASPG